MTPLPFRVPGAKAPVATEAPAKRTPKPLEGNWARARENKQLFEAFQDTEYWIAFCFADARELADAENALAHIRHEGRVYDGLAVAERLGVAIATPTPAWKPFAACRQRLLALSMVEP